MTEHRETELAAALARVEERLRTSCAAADRRREEVTLVVVTKFFPATDVRLLHGLGVRHVGENRHQEGAEKRLACGDLPLTWHFIGGLQSNKSAAVGGWADVVQSVDRARLLAGLSRAAHDRDRRLDVLLQISLDPPGSASGRSGVAPEEAVALATRVREADGLRLRGVMGVAPLRGDAPAAFARLAQVGADVRAVEPSAGWLSAGMSGDLEAAVAAGATHVRIGSAVLGKRPDRR